MRNDNHYAAKVEQILTKVEDEARKDFFAKSQMALRSIGKSLDEARKKAPNHKDKVMIDRLRLELTQLGTAVFLAAWMKGPFPNRN